MSIPVKAIRDVFAVRCNIFVLAEIKDWGADENLNYQRHSSRIHTKTGTVLTQRVSYGIRRSRTSVGPGESSIIRLTNQRLF